MTGKENKYCPMVKCDWKNEKTNGKGKCEYSNGKICVVFTSLSVDEFCIDSQCR